MSPISKLLLPPASLSNCVFAGIYRDTRGCGFAARDRMNHFPASPIVAVSMIHHGDLFLLSDGPSPAPLPTLGVTGPQDRPLTSGSSGDVTVLTVGFYFDAWQRLGGDDRFDTIPTAIADAVSSFDFDAPVDDAWGRLTDRIGAIWAPDTTSPITGISSWARAAATRAALSTTGRSLRSMQRTLKRDSGQTQRTLQFFSAAEEAHRQYQKDPQAPLAGFAVDAGFSDQAHFGRAIRRLTGVSPAALNRAIETEEAFWCYRLLGERF